MSIPIMSTNGRDFVLSVIELYRNSPCLWQVTHEDYHNKHKRNAALEELLILFKTKDRKANLDTVKKKISTIRNSFKKEHNKVKSSGKSGIGADQVHIPKLWYYSEMLFLTDVDTPRPSTSIDSILDDMPFGIDVEIDVNHTSEVRSATPVMNTPLPSPSQQEGTKKNARKSRNQSDELLAKISKKMDEPPPQPYKERYAAYGEHIAEKLRSMSPMMATYCQKIINDAIFLAETKNLNIRSRISVSDIYNTEPLNSPAPEPSQPDFQRFDSQSILDTQNTDIVYDAYVRAIGRDSN